MSRPSVGLGSDGRTSNVLSGTGEPVGNTNITKASFQKNGSRIFFTADSGPPPQSSFGRVLGIVLSGERRVSQDASNDSFLGIGDSMAKGSRRGQKHKKKLSTGGRSSLSPFRVGVLAKVPEDDFADLKPVMGIKRSGLVASQSVGSDLSSLADDPDTPSLVTPPSPALSTLTISEDDLRGRKKTRRRARSTSALAPPDLRKDKGKIMRNDWVMIEDESTLRAPPVSPVSAAVDSGSVPAIRIEPTLIHRDVGRDYTLYIVQFTFPGYGWMIFRRYSAFHSLHSKLSKMFALEQVRFPPKKLLGTMRPSFIEKRRKALIKYMEALLLLEDVRTCPEFLDFCEWQDAEEVKITRSAEDKKSPADDHVGPRRLARGDSLTRIQHVPAESEKPLTIADFEVLKMIGKGGAGEVFLVKKKGTSEVLAMKRMSKDLIYRKNQVSHAILTERDVLIMCCVSDWITQLCYAFQDESYLYFGMEWVCGGDFRSLLGNLGALSEEYARFYLAEMFMASRMLHEFGYIHRDLKPENFLIDRSGHIKLTDFGLSTKGAAETQGALSLNLARVATDRDGTHKSLREMSYSVVGSPLYMAPEILTGEGYGPSVDWWSLGCIMYEMLCGVPPFTGRTPAECFRNVLDFERTLVYPSGISENAFALTTASALDAGDGVSADGESVVEMGEPPLRTTVVEPLPPFQRLTESQDGRGNGGFPTVVVEKDLSCEKAIASEGGSSDAGDQQWMTSDRSEAVSGSETEDNVTPLASPSFSPVQLPEGAIEGPISAIAWDLIKRLLCGKDTRIAFKHVQMHPFFGVVDWDKLRKRDPPFVPSLESETDTFYFESHELDDVDLMTLCGVHPPETGVEGSGDVLQDFEDLDNLGESPPSFVEGFSFVRSTYLSKLE